MSQEIGEIVQPGRRISLTGFWAGKVVGRSVQITEHPVRQKREADLGSAVAYVQLDKTEARDLVNLLERWLQS